MDIIFGNEKGTNKSNPSQDLNIQSQCSLSISDSETIFTK